MTIGWLNTTGVLLEAAGLVVAGVGIAQTWRTHAPDEPFTGPMRERARRLRAQVEHGGRWLLRRPQRVDAHIAAATINVGATISGTASVGFGPLDTSLPIADALAELERRIGIVNDREQDSQHVQIAHNDGVARELGELRSKGGPASAATCRGRGSSVDGRAAGGGGRSGVGRGRAAAAAHGDAMSEPLHVLTGLRWVLDTNLIDRIADTELLRLADLGWVTLEVTDTAFVEIMHNPEKYPDLLPHLERRPMMLGAWTVDHSAVDFFVIGSDEDEQRKREVFEALWPTRNMEADAAPDASSVGRRCFRDALHIDTAMRYLATGFVTRDEPLRRAFGRIVGKYPGFVVVSLEDATERSMSEVAHVRRSAAVIDSPVYPAPGELPDWPDVVKQAKEPGLTD